MPAAEAGDAGAPVRRHRLAGSTAVVAAGPYADVAELLARADAWPRPGPATEVERRLADHPRIGERHAGAGASAAMSGREQAGVDPATPTCSAGWPAGNAAYEERFDRIYLVRAAGRDAEEILALLEQRLDNDPETELAVTAGQLARDRRCSDWKDCSA